MTTTTKERPLIKEQVSPTCSAEKEVSTSPASEYLTAATLIAGVAAFFYNLSTEEQDTHPSLNNFSVSEEALLQYIDEEFALISNEGCPTPYQELRKFVNAHWDQETHKRYHKLVNYREAEDILRSVTRGIATKRIGLTSKVVLSRRVYDLLKQYLTVRYKIKDPASLRTQIELELNIPSAHLHIIEEGSPFIISTAQTYEPIIVT